MKRLIAGVLITSLLFQPLGLVSPVLAETLEMKYNDPKHIHAPKEVNGIVYQYDEKGNLENDGERVISWNQDNLPVKIEKDGKIVEFFYDADGRRIVKKIGENKTIYVNQYYQSSIINHQPSAIKYYFANERVAQSTSDNPSFLHQNYLGSTVLVTDPNSQSLSESLFYFPYGNSIINHQSSIINHLFTGQELDPETNLYNYNARLYNPKTGAFISADSLSGANRYAYAKNNPLVFTDPSGHDVWDIVRDIWETVKTAYGSFLAEQFLYSAGEYKAYEKLSAETRAEKSAVIAGELGVLNLYYSLPAVVSYLQFSKEYYFPKQSPVPTALSGETITVYRGIKEDRLLSPQIARGLRSGEFTLEELQSLPASELAERAGVNPARISLIKELEAEYPMESIKAYLHRAQESECLISPWVSASTNFDTASIFGSLEGNGYVIRAEVPVEYTVNISLLEAPLDRPIYFREYEIGIVGELKREWWTDIFPVDSIH